MKKLMSESKLNYLTMSVCHPHLAFLVLGLLLIGSTGFAGILDWTFFDGGPIEQCRITWNLGYDSVLRQNVGLGLLAVNSKGEMDSLYGYHFEGKFGENGFCINLHYSGILGNFKMDGLMQSLYAAGASIGLSYIYNSEDGTVYETPIRGIGISGKVAFSSICLSLGIYRDIEASERKYFYNCGLSFGF
jgi:hypothetical protein